MHCFGVPIYFPFERELTRLRAAVVSMLLVLLAPAALPAQASPSLPEPVPFTQTIQQPQDTPYKGVISLDVDATDVLRRIYRIRETIPVSRPGTLTLLFPQWTPGDHAPNEPLEKLAGLVFYANGARLHWVRDAVDMHAFRVDVHAGASELEVEYNYLGATGPATGPVLITPTMLDLQWQSLILYPAGHFLRDIVYRPTVTFPAGWTYFTSMDGGERSAGEGDNSVAFPPLQLDALIDQPIMAARYLKQVVLSDSPVPVRLDVAAQTADGLAALPDAAKRFAPIVAQADKLFGSHHYAHYDFLLFLSDELSTYFEHHRSGEQSTSAHALTQTGSGPAVAPDISYLAHGYVHSWNGMYLRPAEMWTPNLNTPERDSMLWMFEGLTVYWADVLSFRAGVYTRSDMEEHFAGLSALMTLDAGADWRPLADVNNDPIILGRRAASWPSWQRNEFDAYFAGEIVWLEADAILRQQSEGKKSLDDFARTFYGGSDAGDLTKTYTFDDLVKAMNAIQPYDWQKFFQSHLEEYGHGRLAHSIDQTGYELVFTDKPDLDEPASKALDLAYSLGMRVNSAGVISAVHWDGPAFRANLTLGETIVSVNGVPYDSEKFTDAIIQAAKGSPLDLVVQRGTWRQSTSIAWRGGLRYPHLRPIEQRPALLDTILAPR